MNDFYSADLAYIHHAGFGAFARDAGEQILGILHDNQIHQGLVVDLGCGSGIWSQCLLQAGYQVLGVDISAAMLDLARRQAPQARFVQGSAYGFPLPSCQVVTALGEVLCYGAGSLPDDGQLLGFIGHVANRLAPGGMLLFDVIAADDEESLDYRSWQKGEDWAVLVDSREQRDAQQLIREITLFREVDGCYRRTDETHRVRVFDTEQLKKMLRECGFDVSVSDHYGEYPLARRRLAFVARKS